MSSVLDGLELAYEVPLYYLIKVEVDPKLKHNSTGVSKIYKTIGVVVDVDYSNKEYKELLCNGFYVHGRAGIFDEMSYTDDKQENQIKPTF
jgi:hypothetical protein